MVVEAEFEIHAPENFVLFGVRPHKQLTDLETVNRAAALRRVRRIDRHIQSLLHPWFDSIGPFPCSVERMIGNDGARVNGLRPSLWGKVAVYHDIEYAWWRDDSIVDLDFVGLGK